MAMSGIEVADECEKAHDRQKQKEKDIQWTVYKICDADDRDSCKGGKKRQEVRVDGCPHSRSFSAKIASTVEAEEGPEKCHGQMLSLWREFVQELPEEEGRYACFDYVTRSKAGGFTEKMRFVSWSPECASIKSKMIYSSTKDSLKKKLNVPKETFLSSKSEDDVKEAFEEMMKDA